MLLGGQWPARGLLSGEQRCSNRTGQLHSACTEVSLHSACCVCCKVSQSSLCGLADRLSASACFPVSRAAGCYPPEGELDEPDPALLPFHSGGGSGTASRRDSGDGVSFGGRAQSLGKVITPLLHSALTHACLRLPPVLATAAAVFRLSRLPACCPAACSAAAARRLTATARLLHPCCALRQHPPGGPCGSHARAAWKLQWWRWQYSQQQRQRGGRGPFLFPAGWRPSDS